MKDSTQVSLHMWLFAILSAVFLGICILLSDGIYTVVSSQGVAYKVNKFSGESEILTLRWAEKIETKKEGR